MVSIRALVLFFSFSITALAKPDPYAMRLQQRNATDTGDIARTLNPPAGGLDGIFYFNGTSLLPQFTLLGTGLIYSTGYLNISKTALGLNNVENVALSTWAGSTNLTTLGTVTIGTWQGSSINDTYISSAATWNAKQNAITTGTTLQYLRGDLSLATFPSIPAAQVNSDWNSVSGVSQILNKPTLSTVATTGAYADLSGKPSLATVATTGAYSDLTGKPTIPAAQVNSDWSASSGLAQILNKPTLATVATSGAYADLSGRPSLATVATTGLYSDLTGSPTNLSAFTNGPGYITSAALANYVTNSSLTSTLAGYATTSALTTGLSGKFNTPSGTTLQYVRGDGTLATFPTVVSTFTNDSGYITTAGARTAISLTTTGTSGAATWNSSTGVLNVPNYTSSSGTVTSVGITSSDFAISGSPVTTSGNITANLNTSGVAAGSYTTVTVTSKGIVTAGSVTTINSGVSRSLSNSTGSTNQYTISSTLRARVTYSITFSFTVTALLGASATVYLEYSTNAGSSWVLASQCSKSFLLGLALTGSDDMNLSGEIPANALVRLRTVTAGGGSCQFVTAQEVTY